MNILVKNSTKRNFLNSLSLLLVLFLFNGCVSLSSYFDQETYTSTTNLKNQTIELMEKGEEAYSSHEEEISKVLNDANSIYERQKQRKNNQISISQWEKLLLGNITGSLEGILTGYFNEWKNTGQIQNKAYIEGKIKNVTIAFDEILKFENQKIRKVNYNSNTP